MGTSSFAFVAVLALAGLLSASAETAPDTIVFEYSQVGADVVLTVEGELTSGLPSTVSSSGCDPTSFMQPGRRKLIIPSVLGDVVYHGSH